LGVGDHLEIWDRRGWDSYLEEKQPRYDEIAESAFQAKRPAEGSPLAAPSSVPANPR
jgi:hypothetical protein